MSRTSTKSPGSSPAPATSVGPNASDETHAEPRTTDEAGGSKGEEGGAESGAATGLGTLFTSENLSKLFTAAVHGAVVAARHGLVPVANGYARPGADQQPTPDQVVESKNPPPDRLTSLEKATLGRAFQKLVLETGDLFVAKFRPAGTEGKVVSRTADASGYRGETSLYMAAAAVKGVREAWNKRASAKAETKRQEQIKAQAEELQPISLNVLRSRNRG